MALDSGLFEELPLTGTLGVLRRAATDLLTDRSKRCWGNIRR
jgi:hypothetical protein